MNTQPVNIPRASLALILVAVLGGISLGLVSLGSISSHPTKRQQAPQAGCGQRRPQQGRASNPP